MIGVQPEHSPAQRRLAGTGLPDQRDDLARRDGQTHPMQRLYAPIRAKKRQL